MSVPEPEVVSFDQVNELGKRSDAVIYLIHVPGENIFIAGNGKGVQLANLPRPGQVIPGVKITFDDGCTYTLTRNLNQKGLN